MIQTNIAKEPICFVMFQGMDEDSPLSGAAHGLVFVYFVIKWRLSVPNQSQNIDIF